jgi:hypothetical protein
MFQKISGCHTLLLATVYCKKKKKKLNLLLSSTASNPNANYLHTLLILNFKPDTAMEITKMLCPQKLNAFLHLGLATGFKKVVR